MFNFFGGAADDSTSGQNDDGEGGAGFLAALFGKGADAGQNDSQPADIFSSTFFDGYVSIQTFQLIFYFARA